ncbi:MAG: hypothetical protein A2787_02500 [Omnitrophica WOR_2 bacterium RIFCSPHIGHO2_01_FULL_48_9]|nr:MAG: hypothetical protein A3D10_01880 [Omnitrophica WOR_2 bacterium RIFCSPHIGHO2_02_FULL_48_11]OGX31924.1 MAG: hypothetical protein A2787_02500 [Omnitrophica WOR_2 bacterium RIFCSPHIGHO2_01_FULL_48_9]
MKEEINHNHQLLISLLKDIVTTKKGEGLSALDEAVESAINLILAQTNIGGKLMLIGNGGSSAIASHMATDFWKNAGVRATAFNDSVSLTCIGNDNGYKHVFEKPLEMFGEEKDVLIAISSSGMSENILRAIDVAQKKKIRIITLSGFGENNPLRTKGEINFYVPSMQYGHVEVIHHAICHMFIDVIIAKNLKANRKVEAL